MELGDLDIETLERVEYRSKHVERVVASGRPRPRHIFRDKTFFYKIWGEDYFDHKIVYMSGSARLVQNFDDDGKEKILGYLYGLYDKTVCPSFVEYIYDRGRLAGYITRGGQVLSDLDAEDPSVDRFIDLFIRRSIESGFVHRDFKFRNIIRLDNGNLSLIDFDTPLVSLSGYRPDVEIKSGSLARFTIAKYREFIRDYIRPVARSADVRVAQAKFRSSSPGLLKLEENPRPKINEKGSDVMAPKSERKLIAGLRLPSGQITPGKRSSRSLRKRNAVVACALDLEGKRVLDVGCADGLHALYMAQTAKEVYGVDHRSSEIEIGRATAKALNIGNVRLEAGDVRDPELFKDVGRFDLAIAWGFLHRVGDIFSLLYSLAPLADALSLEWRTPVLPLMSSVSLAYHPPVGDALDPMNVGSDDRKVSDAEKIEGGTAFWEPTPGAVAVIARRLGYTHSRLLGYGENLESENKAMGRYWNAHLRKVNEGTAQLDRLPEARVHMLFERTPGSIGVKALRGGESRIPEWDRALHDAIRR